MKILFTNEWLKKRIENDPDDSCVEAGGPMPERCEACCGEGKLEVPDPQRDDQYYARIVQCQACQGNGWV